MNCVAFAARIAYGVEVICTPPSTATASPTATVAAAAGDANCDSAVTAADVTALVRNIVLDARVTCGLDDVNGDGVLDAPDVDALLLAIFDQP